MEEEYIALIVIIAIIIIIYFRSAKVSPCKRRCAMSRKLWLEHVERTRNFIFAAVFKRANFAAVREELMQNQHDLGAFIFRVRYDSKSNEFIDQKIITNLLIEHIAIAEKIVTAAMSNLNNSVDAFVKAWYANADEIANAIFPESPKNSDNATFRNMMYDHLKSTLAEATAIIARSSAEKEYELVKQCAMIMADFIAADTVCNCST